MMIACDVMVILHDFYELPSKHIVSHTVLGPKISPFDWHSSVDDVPFPPGGIFVIVPLDGISFFSSSPSCIPISIPGAWQKHRQGDPVGKCVKQLM